LGLTKGIRQCKSTADSSVEKNFLLISAVSSKYLGLVTVLRTVGITRHPTRNSSKDEIANVTFFTLVISSHDEFLVEYRFLPEKPAFVLRRMHSCVLLLARGMRTLQRFHINAKGKIIK